MDLNLSGVDEQKQNCIFCSIVKKEVPATIVYEDEHVLVMLDINPANVGHCLLIPKEHYFIMPQLPPILLKHMFKIAKKISHAMLKGLSVTGTSIFVANGQGAGQNAPHFMVHIIPRKTDDKLLDIPKHTVDKAQLQSLQQILTNNQKENRF